MGVLTCPLLYPNRQDHPTQKPEGLIERMVLASSNVEGNVEINPEYVEMARRRLSAEFRGFDSIDPRAERVPFDLRREELREEYLQNHKKWFLRNHENAVSEFEDSVEALYGKKNTPQLTLLEDGEQYGARERDPG